MEKAKEAVTALLGLAGFTVLASEAGSIAGQALNTLLALGLIGAAYIVWTVWGRLGKLVDIDQFTANVKPIEIDRFAKVEEE